MFSNLSPSDLELTVGDKRLLEDIEAADPRLKKPKLLESHGQAPEQYPSYD